MKSLMNLTFFVLMGTALATTQSPVSISNPDTASHSRPRGNVMDWSLNKINPHDIDYGLRIEELRQTAIDRTIHDYGFWSDFVSVGVLGMMFLIVLWQNQTNRQMRFSSARVVTAYHNELAMARDQVTRLSSEYGQAKRILGEQMEASFVARPQATKRESAGNKDAASAAPDGQISREQLLAENGSLKLQVKTLTTKWQEEQQKNRKLKGE
jgi:hypothetical protein